MASSSAPPRRGNGVVGVFWDIENCNVPHGKGAGRVAEKVRSMPFHAGRSEVDFVVVCDVTKEREDVVDDLNAAQVTVQHVATGKKKNAADEKLRQVMRKFVDTYAGDEATLVLISGDQDFLPDLMDFRNRRGVRVVLLHNRVTGDNLKRAVDEAHDFHELLADVPARPGPNQPLQYTELQIGNVPSAAEMAAERGRPVDVDKKLEEMARAW